MGARQRTPNITGWPGSAGALWVRRLGCPGSARLGFGDAAGADFEAEGAEPSWA
jgi:hypothetical protein